MLHQDTPLTSPSADPERRWSASSLQCIGFLLQKELVLIGGQVGIKEMRL